MTTALSSAGWNILTKLTKKKTKVNRRRLTALGWWCEQHFHPILRYSWVLAFFPFFFCRAAQGDFCTFLWQVKESERNTAAKVKCVARSVTNAAHFNTTSRKLWYGCQEADTKWQSCSNANIFIVFAFVCSRTISDGGFWISITACTPM